MVARARQLGGFDVWNRWGLFWLCSAVISTAMIIEMLGTDLSAPSGVSHMISYSVRWAVPFIYLVVAASALQTLFPGTFPRWLLRNRKYLGLSFAVAMGWQALFIYGMSTSFRDYYFEEIYYLRDELEGSTGYIFLVAMVLTSFRFGSKFLDARQWKMLHTTGIYFLWAYPFSVYWWNLNYYADPRPLDYLFYWSGFFAFALRIFAWGNRRRPEDEPPAALRLLGVGIIAAGVAVAATGLFWQDAVSTFLTAPRWSATLELWLPYWPFEPFLSLGVIGLGVWLYNLSLSR
ncbi:MAG: hypothetical protein QNI96_11435 [Woeseiaceae bacterium]|nr:hypothetical protein [Woeseiaceae bacterium]